MPDAEDFRRIKQERSASRDAKAVTVGQMLHSFNESLVKFRDENRKSKQKLDKMLSDFRAKSRENTKHITSLAEQTASFILDSCQKDQDRARHVYRLFEEVSRILRQFAEENERRGEEIAKMFAQFSDQDVDKKEEIAELCRTSYTFLEALSRKRHERREDIQVILGQLRLENRERVDWMSSMLAKLRADERDRSQEFETKDAKISHDVRAAIDEFVKDRETAADTWNELRSAIELCRAAGKIKGKD